MFSCLIANECCAALEYGEIFAAAADFCSYLTTMPNKSLDASGDCGFGIIRDPSEVE